MHVYNNYNSYNKFKFKINKTKQRSKHSQFYDCSLAIYLIPNKVTNCHHPILFELALCSSTLWDLLVIEFSLYNELKLIFYVIKNYLFKL